MCKGCQQLELCIQQSCMPKIWFWGQRLSCNGMAEEEGDPLPPPVGLDEKEFDEAFRVFSVDGRKLKHSALVPFLKALGLRDKLVDGTVQKVKDECAGHTVSRDELRAIVREAVPSIGYPWPSDDDVKRAFRVFDSEGLGFIKVTLLKRFLVQAQLGVDDSVLERLIRDNCHIDGDDLINYEEFISSIRKYHDPQPIPHQ